MLFVSLLAIGLAGLLGQVCLPPPVWLHGAHCDMLPVIVVCGALYLNPPSAWFLALFMGVARDLVSENHLGWASVCLLAVVLLVQTQERERWRRRWYAQVFFTLVGTMVFLLLDYAGFCVQQHRLTPDVLDAGPFRKMTVLSLFNAALAPWLCGLVRGIQHLFRRREPVAEVLHAD